MTAVIQPEARQRPSRHDRNAHTRELFLQAANAVTDGALRQIQFAGGLSETEVPSRNDKDAQCIERRSTGHITQSVTD